MTEQRLATNLERVGLSCFVEFYALFSASSRLEHAASQLASATPYTPKSCIQRVASARAIINAGKTVPALQLVISSTSPRVSVGTKDKARFLLPGAEASM